MPSWLVNHGLNVLCVQAWKQNIQGSSRLLSGILFGFLVVMFLQTKQFKVLRSFARASVGGLSSMLTSKTATIFIKGKQG